MADFNARTGVPVDVEIARPDIVYRNNVSGAISAAPVVTGGVVMTSPIVNVPGGGASRNVRRPDLVPGVNPYYVNKGDGRGGRGRLGGGACRSGLGAG